MIEGEGLGGFARRHIINVARVGRLRAGPHFFPPACAWRLDWADLDWADLAAARRKGSTGDEAGRGRSGGTLILRPPGKTM